MTVRQGQDCMEPPGKALISAARIRTRVKQLAGEIAVYYRGQSFTIVALMNGSVFFLVDLVRRLPATARIECWTVSSYAGRKSTGKLKGLPQLGVRFKGTRVLVVDDILDTGLTLSKVLAHVRQAGAVDVKACVLLRKGVAREVSCEADWVGFEIGSEFVVGYGLDLDGAYRALPGIRSLTD